MAASSTTIALVNLQAPSQPPTTQAPGGQVSATPGTNSSAGVAAASSTSTSTLAANAHGSRICGSGCCCSQSSPSNCSGATSAHVLSSALLRRIYLSWDPIKYALAIAIKTCIAILGLAAAWMAFRLAVWTSAKDWKQYCAAQNVYFYQ